MRQSIPGRLRRGGASLLWFLRALLGEDRYRQYVEHQSRAHPGLVPLSERDFWRMIYREQDLNPSGRCC
ncbi:YbdD/YjiX family protein [Microbacterium sp. A93]|uniref:YbdD/YjiX family protein n=1 Tax=Microbacterium sp. A93 TaxID=3450716 RepID=UPI003F41F121